MEFEINLRCLLDSKLDAKLISLRFNTPEIASSVRPEIDNKDKNKSAVFLNETREVIWTLHKVKG